MFWRKATAIKYLEAQLTKAEDALSKYADTSAKLAGDKRELRDRLEALQAQLDAVLEVSHAKDGKLIEQAGNLRFAEQELEKTKEKLLSCENELGMTNQELDKAREELRILQERAQTSERAASFGQDLNAPFKPLRFSDEVDSAKVGGRVFDPDRFDPERERE